jgi:hypothetical protein
VILVYQAWTRFLGYISLRVAALFPIAFTIFSRSVVDGFRAIT